MGSLLRGIKYLFFLLVPHYILGKNHFPLDTTSAANATTTPDEWTTTRTATNNLKIAWLLSFPNSGTTYTLQAVQQVSNRSAAANTCLKWVHQKAIPVVSSDGPYQISPHLPLPDTYVLTRTHCAGHYPWPRWFLVGPVTPAQFATACRRMAVVHRWGLWKERQGSYPKNHSTPTKAVHLWRHPLDNIVSRYRHARRYVPAWLMPNLAWYCRLTDMITGKILVPSSSSYFPCRAELDRFITWHNNAMALADTIHPTLQVLHVHYEDYQRNDTQLSAVLAFLELEEVASPSIRFQTSSSSHHHHNTTTTTTMKDGYFTRPHQERMMAYIQKYASPRVWERLQVYNTNNDDDHGNDSISD
jgi:Sulfotransferase domain